MSGKIFLIKKNNELILTQCVLADSFLSRLIGLLNKAKLAPGEGLLLSPCKQVHTFFMSFPIDAIFLSGDNEILAILEMKPWRVSKYHTRAQKVLELSHGTSKQKNLRTGDILEISS